MAQPITQNPYKIIGAQLKTGLNAIIAGLPGSPTIDDLVDEVFTFVEGLYYSGARLQVENEIKSVAYHAINAYRDQLVLAGKAGYTLKELALIQYLVGDKMTTSLPPSRVADRLTDVESAIGTSNYRTLNQVPIFLATTIGANSFEYWDAELNNPASTWGIYFSSFPGENYVNTLYWNVAAMNGALAGYGATPNGLIEPTTDKVTTKMVSALIGGLTLAAGIVIFGWIPGIGNPVLPINNLGSWNIIRGGRGGGLEPSAAAENTDYIAVTLVSVSGDHAFRNDQTGEAWWSDDADPGDKIFV